MDENSVFIINDDGTQVPIEGGSKVETPTTAPIVAKVETKTEVKELVSKPKQDIGKGIVALKKTIETQNKEIEELRKELNEAKRELQEANSMLKEPVILTSRDDKGVEPLNELNAAEMICLARKMGKF